MNPNAKPKIRLCRLLLLWAGASLSAGPAQAQGPSHQPVPVLSFRYGGSAQDSVSGAEALLVHVEIAPGWHINSDAPLDPFLVPTTVEAEAGGLRFGKPRFPRPERVHSEVLGGDMLLFSGAFDVEVPVLRKAGADRDGRAEAPPAARPGAQAPPPRTRVTLKYQACDHATCFPPKEISVER
jgi:hypothetical protein